MQYQSVTAGTFLERPNRFIAMVDLDGRTERVHVKNIYSEAFYTPKMGQAIMNRLLKAAGHKIINAQEEKK